MAKQTTHEIMKDGRIWAVLADGTYIINGHVTMVDGVEKAAVNGYIFDLSELNIIADNRCA